MEFKYDFNKEYFNSSFYGERLYNNKETCLVCYVDETENNLNWERYRLVCGHIFHTRCFRRWCHVKQSVNCSFCGNISEIEQNRFCNMCYEFGHSALAGDDCETLNRHNSIVYIKRRINK